MSHLEVNAEAGTEELLPIADKIFAHFEGAEPWELLPGAKDLLHFLQRKGLILIVVSNWDYRLPAGPASPSPPRARLPAYEEGAVLDALGIGAYFSSVTVAGEVGVEKPNEELFRVALAASQALQAPEVLSHPPSLAPPRFQAVPG